MFGTVEPEGEIVDGKAADDYGYGYYLWVAVVRDRDRRFDSKVGMLR